MSAVARPAVLVLGGSEGGYGGPDLAALLASHGYPALALAYFGEPGLPSTLENIPLEYFGKALQWLGVQSGVAAHQSVVIGVSRGGEAAILTGTTFPTFVRAVVAVSSSSYVLGGANSGYAWTYAGKPVVGELPVERVRGPVLLFAGGEDAVVGRAAVLSFDRLRQRARQHGRPDIGGVLYPHAGHAAVGIPNLPAPGEVKGATRYYELGGEPAANEAAHADSWRRILRLLGAL
jgi:dienelactone hydrolase